MEGLVRGIAVVTVISAEEELGIVEVGMAQGYQIAGILLAHKGDRAEGLGFLGGGEGIDPEAHTGGAF